MAGRVLRVLLDANILFSACRSDGAIRALLRELDTAGHILVVDDYVCAEARRNLEMKATSESVSVLDALLGHCEGSAFNGTPASEVDLDWLADKDRPVMRSAIATRCDALVTGDRRHFGPAYERRVYGVLVLSPVQLYEWMKTV